mmetsp:Transcript_17466/g.48453  ORF Transcript_17466/g.48453 Transcript_17466/m.48453 type:complete len:263 (-) Transcript_17466:2170-2958(-)
MMITRSAVCLLVASSLAQASAFVVPLAGRYSQQATGSSSSSTSSLSADSGTPKGPAGSFFNPIPDDAGNDDDSSGKEGEAEGATSQSNDDKPEGDMEDELFQVLRQRKGAAKVYKPSTIKGVPTSKATGFGAPKKTSSKPYVAIGPPDKRVNDPTKPEYDDQGYTLYSDEKTGEKSRVFEALVDYPCIFTMKIVGANEGAFVEEMVALVAEACETELANVTHSTRVMGKWMSVTVKTPIQSAEMLYSLYAKVDQDPRVKFKF